MQDSFSSHGAEYMKNCIKAYWHDRGFPGVRVERYEIVEGTWGIRSNLVNGMPEGATATDVVRAVRRKKRLNVEPQFGRFEGSIPAVRTT